MRARLLPASLLLALTATACLAQDDAYETDDDATAATYEELAAAPPPLPAALDPLSLHAALTPAQRATVDEEQRVVTFAQRITRRGDLTELEGVSIGTMRQPPSAVVQVLSSVEGYADWLRLQPSYKSVRVEGTRLLAGIGSADEPKVKRQMRYDVVPGPSGVTWTVTESGTPLQPGSVLELSVVAHPTVPGASLVAHRQVGLLPQGRMLKYLGSEDKEGRNRWWKDSNRHARRLHWAIDAACAQPPGTERVSVYVAHHQREFRGKSPSWSR
jgi:hypothetical protein